MAKAGLLHHIGGAKNGESLTWRAYALLALLCLAFYLPGIASLPPTDRDESWFAQATKQMVETGDYVDINFLTTPRYKKPVGIYWLQAASVKLLNPGHLNEIWAYRVPSLIGAVIAVLMTAATGALLFGAEAGFLAAMMLACCLDLDIEAHIAKTDAALLAPVMVMQYALACAYKKPDAGWGNAFAFWSALGIGILLKGPIILLPLLGTLGWLRWKEKRLTWFQRLKPMAGIPYALLLVAPWVIAISMSHARVAAQAATHDFLGKILKGQDRGFLPPGLHALVFPAMFFPFSLFGLLAIPDVWRKRNEPALRFCIGWIVPTWIVFELSSTKLPHYVLPVYPAIAILTAKFLLDGFPALKQLKKYRWYPTAVTGLWLLVAVALAIVAAVLPYYIDRTVNTAQIVISLVFLAAQISGLWLFRTGNRNAAMAAMMFGAMLFSGTLFEGTLPGLKRLWVAREIVNAAKAVQPCSKLEVVSAGYEEPSLAFLAGTDTLLVPNGVYAAGHMQTDPCLIGAIDKRLLRQFLYTIPDAGTAPHFTGSVVQGVSAGNGGGKEMFLYTMPKTSDPIPTYP